MTFSLRVFILFLVRFVLLSGHLLGTRSAHAHYFLLGRLRDITTNQIHFAHDQILKTVSRKTE